MGKAPPTTTIVGLKVSRAQRYDAQASESLLAGPRYDGKSEDMKAGATTRQETPKRKIVVIRNIPRNIVRPVPPWYIKIFSGGPTS